MALLTRKSYPIIICQSEISAAIPGKYDPLRKITSVQAVMFSKFHADSGFMGTTTHNFSIGDLQAHPSSCKCG